MKKEETERGRYQPDKNGDKKLEANALCEKSLKAKACKIRWNLETNREA
jgi:hypothetical protein